MKLAIQRTLRRTTMFALCVLMSAALPLLSACGFGHAACSAEMSDAGLYRTAASAAIAGMSHSQAVSIRCSGMPASHRRL